MRNLESRLHALEDTRDFRIATAIRTQNFRTLTDDELAEAIRLHDDELRRMGVSDAAIAYVDRTFQACSDEQLTLLSAGKLDFWNDIVGVDTLEELEAKVRESQ